MPWKTPAPPSEEPKVDPIPESNEVIHVYMAVDTGKELSPAVIVVDESTSVTCSKCDAPYPKMRRDLLGHDLCPKCTPPVERPLGIMDYGHKTAGSLMLVESRAAFNKMKKPINQQRS